MDDREHEFRVLLVFADRRKNSDATIPDFKNGFRSSTFFIAQLDAMKPLDAQLVHFIGNRMFPISCKAIHAGAHQEICVRCLRCAEELINVTLAVTNVNAPLWGVQKRRGLLQVVQPPNALLLLNRYSRWIDFLLERIAAGKSAPGPKLHGSQTKGQSFGSHGETGMHLNPADNIVLQLSVQ